MPDAKKTIEIGARLASNFTATTTKAQKELAELQAAQRRDSRTVSELNKAQRFDREAGRENTQAYRDRYRQIQGLRQVQSQRQNQIIDLTRNIRGQGEATGFLAKTTGKFSAALGFLGGPASIAAGGIAAVGVAAATVNNYLTNSANVFNRFYTLASQGINPQFAEALTQAFIEVTGSVEEAEQATAGFIGHVDNMQSRLRNLDFGAFTTVASVTAQELLGIDFGDIQNLTNATEEEVARFYTDLAKRAREAGLAERETRVALQDAFGLSATQAGQIIRVSTDVEAQERLAQEAPVSRNVLETGAQVEELRQDTSQFIRSTRQGGGFSGLLASIPGVETVFGGIGRAYAAPTSVDTTNLFGDTLDNSVTETNTDNRRSVVSNLSEVTTNAPTNNTSAPVYNNITVNNDFTNSVIGDEQFAERQADILRDATSREDTGEVY